jgi:Cu/Ag efflux pump CusA
VVVYEASKEIRSAIVFGTAVVILVFLPLFALSGVEGRLFAPLGVAYIVSILASLVVSLTVTPVFRGICCRSRKRLTPSTMVCCFDSSNGLAGYLIRLSIAHPLALMALTWLMVAYAGWELSQLGRNFLPQFDEGSVQINLTLPPGSSLDASNQVSGVIDRKLQQMQKSDKNPDGPILHFVRRTGRAEMDEHASPVNTGEYILSMNPDIQAHREEILKKFLDELREEAPGVDVKLSSLWHISSVTWFPGCMHRSRSRFTAMISTPCNNFRSR